MTTASEHYEQEATEADEREYVLDEMTPAGVRARRSTKAALAVRFDQADLDKLRARAIAEGIGVTQLVRAWVLERLNDDNPGQLPAAVAEAFITLRKEVTRMVDRGLKKITDTARARNPNS